MNTGVLIRKLWRLDRIRRREGGEVGARERVGADRLQ
jgi:hypothetical protein